MFDSRRFTRMTRPMSRTSTDTIQSSRDADVYNRGCGGNDLNKVRALVSFYFVILFLCVFQTWIRGSGQGRRPHQKPFSPPERNTHTNKGREISLSKRESEGDNRET